MARKRTRVYKPTAGRRRIQASKMELSLVPKLTKMGYRHTGNGDWWRTWKDGTRHNPDFVDAKNGRVFEFFGTYWHRKDVGREREIIAAWAAVGFQCTILWEKDLVKFLRED